MNSSGICARCIRNLRQNLRAERVHSYTPAQRPLHNVRSLSTRSPLLQQPQQASSDQQPAVPPISTATITSNPTATPPTSSSTTSTQHAGPDPSTAEMQRQINSRLSSSSRPTLASSLAQRMSKTKTAETYITYGLSERLFKVCSAQADYTIPESQRTHVLSGKGPTKTTTGEDLGMPTPQSEKSWWLDMSSDGELGLQATFSTWSQVAYLHMYLLMVRLRALESPAHVQNYQRYLLEHFSQAAEDKMLLLHSMGARGIRNRYLKDLFLQWRGVLAAYDEGLVKGDAVLAAAVWRNLWKGSEDVDWTKVALVVGWMRVCLIRLDKIPIEDLIGRIEGTESVFQMGKQQILRAQEVRSRGLSEPI